MLTLRLHILRWDITRRVWQFHLGWALRWERCGAAVGDTTLVGAATTTSPSITTTTSSTTATGKTSTTATGLPTNLLGATATGSTTRSTVVAPLTPTERWQINTGAPRGATPCRIDRRMRGRTRPGSNRQEGRDMSGRGTGASAGSRDAANRGAGGAGNQDVSNRGGASAGTSNMNRGGGGDRVGNQQVPNTPEFHESKRVRGRWKRYERKRRPGQSIAWLFQHGRLAWWRRRPWRRWRAAEVGANHAE